MTNEEDRNTEICKLYVNGLTLRQLGERFGLTHERVRQILRKAGVHTAYRKKAVRAVRKAFLGINISDEAKVALCQEAIRRGMSMSSLTSDWIEERLAALEPSA